MLLKPIENKKIKVNQGLILKLLFLSVVVFAGIYAASHQPTRTQTALAKNGDSPTPASSIGIGDLKGAGQDFANNISTEGQKAAGNILGEFSKTVDDTASKSADAVTDYVYQNTMEQLIRKLYDTLPERRKEVFRKSLEPTATPTPMPTPTEEPTPTPTPEEKAGADVRIRP